MTHRRSLLILLLAALGHMSVSRAAEGPQPLLELTFGRGLANTGTLGGTAVVREYADGEGPVIGPGQKGTCVQQLRPSRAGGPGHTPAGGDVAFEADGLNDLPTVTLIIWFRPEGTNRIARLLYFSNQWDVYISGAQVAFSVRHEGRDQHRVSPRERPLVRDREWNVVAVTHDRAQGTATLYHATLETDLTKVTEWTEIPVPDSGTGLLQIGNLGQIRPFRGSFDSVRIYGTILSDDEISERVLSERRKVMTLEHSAATMPELPGLLSHGDVLLSSRSKRQNSIETIQAFEPDRVMWCYSNDAAFITDCRQAGIQTFQSAINSIAGTTEPEAQALDLDGKPVVAPWMVTFNPKKPWYWGCNNRPRFLDYSVERAGKALAAGADWIQFDDWSMVVSAHSWGGACFCDPCMAGFRAYLSEEISSEQREALGIGPLDQFDYRTHLRERCGIVDAADYRNKRRSLATTPLFERFQRMSVRRFFTDLRQRLDSLAGRRVPLSLNATLYRPSQAANYTADIVDFLQGETWHMDLVDLAVPARTAESIGRWQVFVPKPRELRTARRAIAASYALGQLMLVPWDMYMGSDATGIQPRYYGTPEQYGDIFSFAKANGSVLDGYETCAWAAVVVNLDNLDNDRVRQTCTRLFEANVPFRFAPVGSSYYPAALERSSLSTLQLIVLTCPPETLPETERQTLQDLAEQAAVIPDTDLTTDQLRPYSPLAVWGPDGIVALPRAPRDANAKTLALHILNRTQLEQVRWVSVMLRKGALSTSISTATWRVPGREPELLQIEEHAEGTRLIIPELPIWGIAELALE